jgi:hypothetical protein
MAANQERWSQPLCSLALPLIYKLAKSGACEKVHEWIHIDRKEGFFDPPKQPHNPEPGMDTIGEWIGTFYRRVIDGKTR